jgi:protein-L-isoaspartate(D-aspartate) O-methyltransferase
MSYPVSEAAQEAVPFEAERRAMVEQQIRRRGVRDERVLEAMFSVPRHEFVRPEYLGAAYEDRPLPIGTSETISQPYIVAAMTAAARISSGDKVLEIGTGAGYQAAVLAFLGADVVSIERNGALADAARQRLQRLGFDHVRVIEGDGTEGYPAGAPYRAILVTAAAPRVPEPLIEQLADGGRLVIPVGDRYRQDLLQIFKHGAETSTQFLDPCQFVPLIGKHGWPGPK